MDSCCVGMDMIISDIFGNSFSSESDPRRIISLVPSTTETLYDLGLGDRVVGVTRFCVHPSTAREEKILVGGTKNIAADRIQSCQADLVIGNQEENSEQIYTQLQLLNIPTCFFFPKTVNQAILDIEKLSRLFHRSEEYKFWFQKCQANRVQCTEKSFRFVYLIWRKPWMSVNGDCFISSMLREIGGENIFADHPERYFSCTLEEIKREKPDVLLLSSEPFPFQEKHKQELLAEGFGEKQIRLINGELCSWHGTRMAKAFLYLNDWVAEL